MFQLDIDKDGEVSYEEFSKVILAKIGTSMKKNTGMIGMNIFNYNSLREIYQNI